MLRFSGIRVPLGARTGSVVGFSSAARAPSPYLDRRQRALSWCRTVYLGGQGNWSMFR